MWAEIDKALSRLEGEQSVLASVIEGKVDQYVLDGKDIGVKIPAVLLERMERLSHKVSQKVHNFRLSNISCTLTGHFNLQLSGFCEPVPTVAAESCS